MNTYAISILETGDTLIQLTINANSEHLAMFLLGKQYPKMTIKDYAISCETGHYLTACELFQTHKSHFNIWFGLKL